MPAGSTLPAEFTLLSPLHLWTVGICAAIILTVTLTGLRLKRTRREHKLRLALAFFAFMVWILMQAWYLAHYDGGVSWPLHICDIASLIAPVIMLYPARWLRAILYFWGFALTTQGFITPVLIERPNDPEFWLFWLNHSIVVGYAIYDVAVGGFRPRFADVVRVTALTLLLAAIILPLDLAMGWNYLFIGRSNPATPTLIDHLGPWPLRLLWMILLAFAAFTLVWLPWIFVQPVSASKTADRPESDPLKTASYKS